MLKKGCAVFLALCAVFCLLLPAAAESTIDAIKVTINSDIDGVTENDAEKLFTLQSDNVIYWSKISGPLTIADYGGTEVDDELKAGRTYFIHYYMEPAEGFELPDQISDIDLQIDCGKGVTVINTAIIASHVRLEDGTFDDTRGVSVYARVVVDGNVLQRITGLIHDVVLKIKAWSLY